MPFSLTLHVFSCFALCLCVVDGLLFSIFLTRCPFHWPVPSLFSFYQRQQATTFISQFLLRSSTLEMFTATQIGALTLSILAASEDVLARPLLAFRQSTNSSVSSEHTYLSHDSEPRSSRLETLVAVLSRRSSSLQDSTTERKLPLSL